jgi:hypothetical protein
MASSYFIALLFTGASTLYVTRLLSECNLNVRLNINSTVRRNNTEKH